MERVSKNINEGSKPLFEKAIKYYFFARQQDISKLNSSLAKRVSYAGSVAYSMIITFIREDNLKIEYMDFLNEELKKYQSLDSNAFIHLQVKPHEIDEIELGQKVSFGVYDEDEEKKINISYYPGQGKVRLETESS